MLPHVHMEGAGGRPVEAVMNEEHEVLRVGGSIYPAGPKITRREFDEAKKLAPVDTSGRLYCWDFMCYAGCKLAPADCLAQNKRIHEMPAMKVTRGARTSVLASTAAFSCPNRNCARPVVRVCEQK